MHTGLFKYNILKIKLYFYEFLKRMRINISAGFSADASIQERKLGKNGKALSQSMPADYKYKDTYIWAMSQ